MFENTVCKMAAILSQLRWVEGWTETNPTQTNCTGMSTLPDTIAPPKKNNFADSDSINMIGPGDNNNDTYGDTTVLLIPLLLILKLMPIR